MTLSTVLQSVAVVLVVAVAVKATTTLSAGEESCVARNKTVGTAILLYTGDYDGRFPPVAYFDRTRITPLSHVPWSLLIGPYYKDPLALRCPDDPHAIAGDLDNYIGRATQPGMFEPFGPRVTSEYDKLVVEAQRTNHGYNQTHLSPIGGPQGIPRLVGQMRDPNRTLMCVDTVRSIDPEGNPAGGGTFTVVPPAKDNFEYPGDVQPWAGTNYWGVSWKVDLSFKPPARELLHSGVYGWHSSEANLIDRRTVVLFVDGSVQVMPISRLLSGTTSAGPKQERAVTNPSIYLWGTEGLPNP